jgi:branched-chain amino acid transport system substrate-binding protein
VVVLAAAAGGGWLASRPSTGLPEGPFAIGTHVPLSGPAAPNGIAIRNAVQLAIDQAGEAGALAGMELGVKAHDTGGQEPQPDDPDRGAAAARQMARDPRTIASIGPFTSPVAGSTIPITNRAGLLECSPSNSYPGLTKPESGALEFRAAHPERINYVRLSPSADVASRALAAFATHDLHAESALVVVSGEWELCRDFAEAFSRLGGQVAQAKLSVDATAADARSLLQRAARPDVVVFAGDTLGGAPIVRKAMRKVGLSSTPFLSWDTILDGSGASPGSYLQRTGNDAAGTYAALTAIAPPRADFVDAYRAMFGEEPTDWAAAAYACTQVILASLEAAAEDGPNADELREAVRAHAVDPSNRYETVLGTVGFDANGDSTQQMISFYRVDPEAADGAGDWVLMKQQDFGPPQ